MLSKAKDRLCLPSAAQRELDAARWVLGVASTPVREKPAPAALPCSEEQRQLTGARENTLLLSLCWCSSTWLPPAPERCANSATVVALREPQQAPRGPAVSSRVRVYPHALGILPPLHTLIATHAGGSVCDKSQRCILNYLFMPSRHNHLRFLSPLIPFCWLCSP